MGHTPKPYVRQAFRKYLECGIFAHGFARAWCDDCGHDYLAKRGLPEATLNNICIGNYSRVLKKAMKTS